MQFSGHDRSLFRMSDGHTSARGFLKATLVVEKLRARMYFRITQSLVVFDIE